MVGGTLAHHLPALFRDDADDFGGSDLAQETVGPFLCRHIVLQHEAILLRQASTEFDPLAIVRDLEKGQLEVPLIVECEIPGKRVVSLDALLLGCSLPLAHGRFELQSLDASETEAPFTSSASSRRRPLPANLPGG